MIIVDIVKDLFVGVKIMLVTIAIVLAILFFMFLFFYVPYLAIILFFIYGMITSAVLAILTVAPLFLLYKQVKKDVFIENGAVVSGMLWWLVSYSFLAICLSIIFNNLFIKEYFQIVPYFRSIAEVCNKVGMWSYPIAVTATFPIGVLAFYFQSWKYRRFNQ